MTNQDPRVDRSRGAVYQAEDSVASVMRRPHRMVRVGSSVVTLPEEVRFGSLAAIQGFVDARAGRCHRAPGSSLTGDRSWSRCGAGSGWRPTRPAGSTSRPRTRGAGGR